MGSKCRVSPAVIGRPFGHRPCTSCAAGLPVQAACADSVPPKTRGLEPRGSHVPKADGVRTTPFIRDTG